MFASVALCVVDVVRSRETRLTRLLECESEWRLCGESGECFA